MSAPFGVVYSSIQSCIEEFSELKLQYTVIIFVRDEGGSMADRVTLPLKDTKGRPLMHKFYRQERDMRGLLVTFPGGNYGMDGPLLYYPSELLQAAGWDTLALTYSFQVDMKSISPDIFPDLMEESRTSIATTLA